MTLSIGIDLGTTNTVAAVATTDGLVLTTGAGGERIHPSVVSFPEGGGVLVGQSAAARRAIDPENTIYSAKRLIGQNIRAPLVQLALSSLPYGVEEGPNQQPIVVSRARRLTVPQLSGLVLDYVTKLTTRQHDARVTEAVITVPANFKDAQRRATREAGERAGLEVMRLVNEPTAAALAYGYSERRDENVAIYDFGGGTFDVSIMRIRGDTFEVLASDGDFFLGGDDLDRALAEHLAAELNRTHRLDVRGQPLAMTRLMIAAEQIKQYLSHEQQAEGTVDQLVVEGAARALSLPFAISRKTLEHLIAGYVDRTIQLCRNVITAARLRVRDLSAVICVGGSTRIPMVMQRLAEVFDTTPRQDINPDEVVAQGAAIHAASLAGQSRSATASIVALPDTPYQGARPAGRPAQIMAVPIGALLMDVTPASLRIATAGGYTERLLEKNAPIPIERTRVFSTAHDGQTRVVIDCCRGEAATLVDNEPLGTLVLDDLAPAPRGQTKIEVTFRVDADGILHVSARDVRSGRSQDVSLNVLGAPAEPVP
ncbi:MAG TPA: Hsp70 family protein [Kofleriaceae bacterium]|nr:Hsp70 family protein [Kofleriaceae bacterium]